MTPPFPWSLPPGAARLQAVAVLALFYSLVYGSALLIPLKSHGAVAAILSTVILGLLMLAAVSICSWRDVSWRGSLGLGRLPVRSALGWGLLGFLATYTVNVMLTVVYLLTRGGLETQVAGRMEWLANLADIPTQAILPLAAFVAFWEETIFRGFLLGRLRASLSVREGQGGRLWREATAVLLCGVCFGAGHGYQGVLGLIQTTTAGIVLGALTVWRGSLWPAMGAHLAIDAFGLFVIKVVARAPGGAAGPGTTL